VGSGRENGYDEADTEGTQNGFGGEVHSVRVQRSLMEAVSGLAGRTQLCTVIKRHPGRNLSEGGPLVVGPRGTHPAHLHSGETVVDERSKDSEGRSKDRERGAWESFSGAEWKADWLQHARLRCLGTAEHGWNAPAWCLRLTPAPCLYPGRMARTAADSDPRSISHRTSAPGSSSSDDWAHSAAPRRRWRHSPPSLPSSAGLVTKLACIQA
jgi:hypothetical protein